jgi:hypothetical protein
MPSKTHLLLLGKDLARLVEISANLNPKEYAHVIAQSHYPLEYLMGTFRTKPEVAIVEMTGKENVVELHEALHQHLSTAFLFLVPEMPPSAAIAKVVGQRGVFLDRGESAVSISATAVALVHQRREDARRA